MDKKDDKTSLLHLTEDVGTDGRLDSKMKEED